MLATRGTRRHSRLWAARAAGSFLCLAGVPLFVSVVGEGALPVQASQTAQSTGTTVEQVLARYRAAAFGTAPAHAVGTLVADAIAHRAAPFPHEARFVFRYSSPSTYQVAQSVPPSAALGPLVFTLNGSASWFRGVQSLGPPLTTRTSLSIADRQTIQVRRRILETALGIIPADLAASGTVKFGGVRQMVDQGQQVAVISVSDSGGEFGTISFSSSTGLPVKATVKVLINALKLEEFERTILFSDYRKSGTMLAPFTITREDGSLKITVSSYAMNPRIPLDLYQPPTTEEQLKRIVDYRGPTG